MTKLSGSTLIEVLMSLSLLSIVFVMGFALLQQLIGIQSPVQQFQHRTICRQVLYEPIASNYQAKEEREIKGRRLVKTIEAMEELYLISVECYWGDKLLLKRSRIVQR